MNRIVHAVDSLPAKRPAAKPSVQEVAAVRAREMLERIRRGEYEFSGSEICEILQRNNWLGTHEGWFESLNIPGENLVELHLCVPVLGRLVVVVIISDLWHDCRVSSLDFQICSICNEKWRGKFYQGIVQWVLLQTVYFLLRWNGSWRRDSLRFVLRTGRTVRLYVEWPEKRSPLLGNISVIGARIRKNSIVFYTFRRFTDAKRELGMALPDKAAAAPTAFARVAVIFSWLLLGIYAFVLVHVTLPVLGGAFRLMPQDATVWHIWVLKQIYNLCVILLSYFFLRITMLPLYLKWNKSKEDLATLMSLEERDHQYLRPLTELVKKMQQAGQSIPAARSPKHSTGNVSSVAIVHMIELMSTIREQSRQRLLGMTRMRRGWVQDLLIGYLFIFTLEWMYYKGLLTPLSVSIKWVNRIMVGLFLPD